MEYDRLITQRYSVRKFSDQPIEEEKLQAILKAGQKAPTARNTQPQRILVLKDSSSLEKIKKCTPCHYNAPVVLLVCFDKNAETENDFGLKFGPIDTSIVLTHMMLEAFNLNIGNVWVGMFDPILIRKLFNIPDNYEILSLMPIGYPAEDAEPSQRHGDRYQLSHTVYYDSF